MEMVVLNTSETISDLLNQRSAIYSCKVRDPDTHPRRGLVLIAHYQPSIPMVEL